MCPQDLDAPCFHLKKASKTTEWKKSQTKLNDLFCMWNLSY